MAKIMKKAADGYTNYGAKAGTPSPVTDYAGKPGKQDSYTQYKKGGVIKKKAQNGVVAGIKKAASDTTTKKGMNFDKKSFDSLPKIKTKAKSGGSFPDLNKDGKITKADILKGRGVIAKKGIKTAKKMQYGGEAASMAPTMKKGGMAKKYKNGGSLAAPTKGGVSMQLGSYTRQIGKNYTGKSVANKGAKAKMGKSMGKCKNGC